MGSQDSDVRTHSCLFFRYRLRKSTCAFELRFSENFVFAPSKTQLPSSSQLLQFFSNFKQEMKILQRTHVEQKKEKIQKFKEEPSASKFFPDRQQVPWGMDRGLVKRLIVVI